MRAKITFTVVLLICFASPAAIRAQQTPTSGLENWETLAKVRFGQETEVKLKDGSKIKGSKVFADDSKLTLYSGKKTLVINRDQVAQVFIEIAYESRKESAIDGAVAGGIGGALFGGGVIGGVGDIGIRTRAKYTVAYSAIFAAVGALKGALAPDEKHKNMLIYEAKK